MGPGAQRQADREAAKAQALQALHGNPSAGASRQSKRRAALKARKAAASADRKSLIANRRKKGAA